MQDEIEQRTLGKTPGKLVFDSVRKTREISVHMLRHASRRILIFSRDLDPRVFDQQPFLDGIKRLALGSHQAKIQVLLQDNEKVVKQGHRLIELAQRLSDNLEIRKPHPDYLTHPENFMLVDRSGFVHRKLATRYEGTADFHDPLETRRLQEFFKELWETSEPDPELRRLNI